MSWELLLTSLPAGLARPASAALVLLAYGGLCGWTWWRHRRRNAPVPGAATGTLVAYASQTGFAEMLAERTADALRAAGQPAWVAPLGRLEGAMLADTGRVLFILSTTGEGDAPDMAAPFVSRTMAGTAALTGLEYGILALGDREYRQFCAFGHAVDGWLRHQGARPLFDLVEVDNGDAGALRHWQHHLSHLTGDSAMADWAKPDYAPWMLRHRHLLNEGSPGAPVYHLAFDPPDGNAVWQAGDVAEIGPGNDPAHVAALLAVLGLDGACQVTVGDRTQPMADWLRTAQLPADPALWQGLSPADLCAGLEPLPHREYSIASIPADGRLELVVRQMRGPDGRLGLGSGWLTRHAALDGPVLLRLRRNAGFHPPDTARPMILIGNGTGIAGLRAQLKAQALAGHGRNWLLFGERTRQYDSLFADELAAWQAASHLTRLDLAFSRDQQQRVYVQDVLAAAAGTVREWVADGAAIYVCGSLEGMAGGVDAVLRVILGEETLEQMAAERLYCRDVY